jgi:hypothetical protein
MTSIEKLYNQIIPPADYSHRNGFSNNHIIDNLSSDERVRIEEKLIENLSVSNDNLIGETLAYMKSFNALPLLRQKLESSKEPITRILWASYIYQIRPEEIEMKDIAFSEFINVHGKYELISLFHTLTIFGDKRIIERIATYTNDKDYLVAYNARTSLGQDTKELIEKEQIKNKIYKPWWKVW